MISLKWAWTSWTSLSDDDDEDENEDDNDEDENENEDNDDDQFEVGRGLVGQVCHLFLSKIFQLACHCFLRDENCDDDVKMVMVTMLR